jgi:hypothetical protein
MLYEERCWIRKSRKGTIGKDPYMYNSLALGAHATVPLYEIICPLSLLSHSFSLLPPVSLREN